MQQKIIDIIINEINNYKKDKTLTEADYMHILEDSKISKYFEEEFVFGDTNNENLEKYNINDDFFQLVKCYLAKMESEIMNEEIDDYIELDNEIYDETPMVSSMSLLMRNIGQYPILTPEEERDLFIKYNNGDDSAKEKLVKHNQRLVLSIAKRYKGISVEEAFQEGCIGLMKAIERFKIDKGYKLSTYATWWIKQSIERYRGEASRTIRIPVHRNESINKIIRARKQFELLNGRLPSNEELVELTSLSLQVIKEIERIQPVVSLDLTIGETDHGEDTYLADFIEANNNVEDEAMDNILKEEIIKLLSTLTDRERQIITLRFGLNGCDPMTLDQIGKILNVTRERIRQIESKILNKLKIKTKSRKDEFMGYLR